MASPDHFAELREKTRRIYALSFWGIAVPARLRNLEICLRNVFDLLTDVQKFFTSNGATQSEIEETYCSVLIGLSEDLDRFQSALSRWIDDPRKLEDTDSREIRQHMIESLPSREVIQRAHETLFLYSYLLGKVVENDRVDQQTHTHRTIPSGPRLRELAEDSLQGWPSLPISQRQQRFLHLRQDVDGNEYGRLIGMKLKLKMNNALREGHSSHTGSRTKLQLAAYWLMKSENALADISMPIGENDVHEHFSQIFLDVIKAAMLLGSFIEEKDQARTNGIILILVPMEKVAIEHLMKFRNNIFDVPDYDLLDKCDSTVSIPPPKDGRKQYADTHRTSSDYPLSATFRSQLSDERKSTQTGKTRDLPISLSPILAQDQPDELVQSPKSMSPSGLGQQMRGRTASDSGLASAVATRTNVVSPPERQPTQQVEDSQKSDYIRHNSQPVKAVPSGCQSTSELEPPAPDQPTTRQRNLSFTEKEVALNRTRKGGASREVGYRGRRPSSPNANPIGSRFIGNQGTASREQSIGSWSYQEQTDASPAPQLRWSPEFVGEPRMEQPGLQVTAKETVIAGAGDVEAEDGEEELLNENVSVDATPKHFDSDIVAVGPLVPGSQSLPMACKVRIFKHKLNEGIRVRTDRDGKIRGDRLEKHVELVPSYAFADDEAAEGAAIYFRSKGTQVGLKYKFLKTPNGTSALYGFQGAMLGMTFGDEYQVLEAVLKNAKGSEVLKYPRLQFWSDRSQEAAAQSSSEGTKSSHRSSIISKTISPKEASLGSIEKVKKTLNCTRLFIFTKIPRPAIYVLIVDETTTIGVPPSPKLSFRPRSPQKHSLCIAPDKAKGDDKIRLHQIRDGAGIPLDLNGLLYKDLYGSGFVEYKTLQLDFYSKEGCESFRQDFNEFRDDWDAHLESPRKEMDVQRDPRIRIKSSVENNRSFKVLGFDTIG